MSIDSTQKSDARDTRNGERAADDLFRIFEQKINSGELADGDRLPPEREIAAQYGVSRTVVRETVLALSTKGLIEAKSRYRPVVRRPNYQTALQTVETVVGRLLREDNGIRNLYDTRIMLEVAMVREAAKLATDKDFAAMQDALDQNGAAIENSDEFYKTDIILHGTWFRVTDNPVLPAIHTAYTSWLAPLWTKMPRLPDRNEINYQAHSAIVKAIIARNPDAAEAAMRRHMDDAWAQVKITFTDL